MSEKVLKVAVGFGLLVLYFQYLIIPEMRSFFADKQALVNIKSANKSKPVKVNIPDQVSNALVNKGFEDVNYFLPSFEEGRRNIWQRIDQIKSAIPGKWVFTPNPTFSKNGNLVRWPFKMVYEGKFQKVVELVSQIEAGGQLIHIKSLQINSLPNGIVQLSSDLELLFLDSINQ